MNEVKHAHLPREKITHQPASSHLDGTSGKDHLGASASAMYVNAWRYDDRTFLLHARYTSAIYMGGKILYFREKMFLVEEEHTTKIASVSLWSKHIILKIHSVNFFVSKLAYIQENSVRMKEQLRWKLFSAYTRTSGINGQDHSRSDIVIVRFFFLSASVRYRV